MKISTKDVQHVARLSRLRFSEDQISLLTHQLNAILEYFEKLQELDTTGVEPSTHAVNLTNVFREDRIKASLTEEESLKNGPSKERGCFKVPKVIEG